MHQLVFGEHKQHLEAILAMVKETLAHGPVHLRIATYCTSGVHRSVAVTALLRFVLRKVGCLVSPVAHWSEYYMGEKRCQRGTGGRCFHCNEPAAMRDEAYEEAWRLWSRAGEEG